MSQDSPVDFEEYHKKANRGSHNGWTIVFHPDDSQDGQSGESDTDSADIDNGVERDTSIGFFAWYAAELDDEATVIANDHDDEDAYVESSRVQRGSA